jgi:apolipoprotein N-acyltransferase
VAICYEIADGRALAGASRAGGLWLLASANLDPYPALLQEQFLALARLRAIENGRWLVAAANTGPSVAVDAIGRVRQRLPTGQPAEALIQVSQRSTLTPYGRWGEGPLLALLLLATAQRLGWFRTRRPPGRPR